MVFIVIFVIYAYIGISVWFTYSLSKGEKKRHHIGVMISFFFPIFTNIFFLPFINVLFSIFNCTKGKHYYIKVYSCSGTYYYTIKRSIIYSNNKSLKFQYIKITHIYLLLHSKRINTIHYYSI